MKNLTKPLLALKSNRYDQCPAMIQIVLWTKAAPKNQMTFRPFYQFSMLFLGSFLGCMHVHLVLIPDISRQVFGALVLAGLNLAFRHLQTVAM